MGGARPVAPGAARRPGGGGAGVRDPRPGPHRARTRSTGSGPATSSSTPGTSPGPRASTRPSTPTRSTGCSRAWSPWRDAAGQRPLRPRVEVPDDADEQTRLIAFTGQSVPWWRPRRWHLAHNVCRLRKLGLWRQHALWRITRGRAGPEVHRPHVLRIVGLADQAGMDTLWAMDHLFQIPINGPA